jgi:hypothetical protein
MTMVLTARIDMQSAEARKEVLAIELELLRIRGMEQAEALENLRAGIQLRVDATGQYANRTDPQLGSDIRFVPDPFRQYREAERETLLRVVGPDLLKARKTAAELELTNLAVQRGEAALSGQFANVGAGGGAGSGGGGGGAARAQTDALADLVAALEDERAALAHLTPLQREMLQHREQLAGMTEVERAMAEGLIATHVRQTSAMEALNFATDAVGDSLVDAFMGGQNAGEMLVETLKRAVLQAALLGEGPLNGLFGGGPGLVGMIFGGLKLADGRRVAGPGGPAADLIPAMLSDGEFVVNAAATARHEPFLEAINSGCDLPGFARGGIVRGGGGPAGAAGSAAGSSAMQLTVRVEGARGNAEIEQMVRQGVTAGLRAHDRDVLPSRVRQVKADPRRLG